LKREPASTSVPLDIGTTAYENIRSTWLRRLIWDKKWGTLPGMSWKHERPLEDLAIDSGPGPFELPAAELNRRFHILGNGEREQPRGEDLDDYPAAVVFEPPAAGSNPLFPMPGNGQRPRSPSIDSTVDLGGNAQRSRSTSRSPPHIVRRNDPSTRRHGLRQREQNRSLTAAPLGPIHQSKVVKLPRTRRPGRGQRAAGKVSDHSASSLGAEQREPGGEASSTSRRRSRRLQNKAEDAGKLISTDIPKNLPGARRERTGAGTIKPKAPAKPQASAKPRGVSRRKPSNTSNRGKKA
jgi:hypothetical protein